MFTDVIKSECFRAIILMIITVFTIILCITILKISRLSWHFNMINDNTVSCLVYALNKITLLIPNNITVLHK